MQASEEGASTAVLAPLAVDGEVAFRAIETFERAECGPLREPEEC